MGSIGANNQGCTFESKEYFKAAHLLNSWTTFGVASITCLEAAFDVIKETIITIAYCKSEEDVVITRWTAYPMYFGTVFTLHLERRVMTDVALEKRDISMMHRTILMVFIIYDYMVKKIGFAWVVVGTSSPDLLIAITTQLETFWVALLASFELSCGGPTLATLLSIVDIRWEDLRELPHPTLDLEELGFATLRCHTDSCPMLSKRDCTPLP